MAMQIELGSITVDVVLKDVKNVHLTVFPPEGTVRITAPVRMSLDTIRIFAISKLGWIKQQRKKFQNQQRESEREYLERETHYVWGKRYLLTVLEADEAPSVELQHSRLVLRVRPGADDGRRQAIVEDWYRWQLKKAVPALVAKWEPLIGVKVTRFFVQRMKTKWGSCTPATGSIRLNTELAKKSPESLEYIIVHEMAHLLVRRHDGRFIALMDRFLPKWRHLRDELNAAPLAHSTWSY